MDDKDKPEDEDKTGDEGGIPLLHDVVFDPDLPLRAPKPAPAPRDHGPDYDPDTIDLFDDAIEDPAQAELREGAERVIEDLVAEYSKEITDRLRSELTEQLDSILTDLKPDQGKNDANKHQ